MCKPNDTSVNTTESKVCGIPKTTTGNSTAAGYSDVSNSDSSGASFSYLCLISSFVSEAHNLCPSYYWIR